MEELGRLPDGTGLSQAEPEVSALRASIPSAVWPIYEFRPRDCHLRGTVLRYADGQWLPDDGSWDLAFISYGAGAPICIYVDLPYQRNIIWKGLTTHWTGCISEHPRGNPWHYMLRDGETDWGGDWGRSRHPNSQAGDEGMSKCASINRCANGRGIHFNVCDPHIVLGLLRERESGEIVRVPPDFTCMYCGDGWRDALLASAIEAGTAETQSGSVHESAVAKPDARP